jgi:hypothetical protein
MDKPRRSFNKLKNFFNSALIYLHLDPLLLKIVEIDVSDFAIGAILYELEDDKLQPVTFYSCKIDKLEINYKIHDKEIVAMIGVLNEWR